METDKSEIVKVRRRLIIAVLCALLCVGVVVGAVFAYTRLAFKSESQTIVASNVFFRVNGKTFRDEITEQELSFTRGESRDVDLAVEFISNGSESAVNYSVNLQLGDGSDNALARAIEVYRKTDGGYIFFGMLSELNDYTADGVAVANQDANVESFRLVYSPGAGDSYEGKKFNLRATVTGTVTTSTVVGDVVYVNHLTQTTATDNVGKTVRLMNDVTLSDNITFGAPVLLDLNGHNLTINSGRTLTVDYSDGANGSAYAAYGSLSGIVDSKTGGSVTGSVVVNNSGSDLYIIGDGVTFGSAPTVLTNRVSGFFDVVRYNYENRVTGKTFVSGDEVPLLANLGYYVGKIDFAITSDVLTQSGSTVTVSGVEMTNNYSFTVSGNDGTNAYSVRGGIVVRGSSAYSVATAYIDALPSELSASLFLPVYDRASGLSLTWITDDGSGGAVFDSDGAYLKGGLDGLDDFSDRTVRIRLIASGGGIGGGSDEVGNYYTTTRTLKAVLATAEQRTDMLYATGQIILQENQSYAFADYFNAAYFERNADGAPTLNKTGLTNITVDVGETGGEFIAAEGEGLLTRLIVTKVPDKTSVSFEISVTFTYTDTDSVTVKTDTLQKSVLVLGYSESVTLDNAQSTIQSRFDETEYARTGGGEFDFSVLSYLSGTGDLVEYVLPDGVDYIFVRDDVYQKSVNGRFFYTESDGKYTYFAAYYTTTGASASDYDVELNGTYYKETDNRNGAYVIVNGAAYPYDSDKCYDRTSVFSVLPEKVPPYDVTVHITARIFRLDADGNKLYCHTDGSYSADTVGLVEYDITLTVRAILHNRAGEIEDAFVYAKLLEYYDLNGDGYIGINEARAEFVYSYERGGYFLSLDGVNPSNNKLYSSYAIDLSNLNVKSIGGLEYFTNARGYDISGNSVSDLSPLSQLTKLTLLYASSNLITDISPLAYLDNLENLDISYNNITDISALEYLRNLKSLSLANNSVSDFLSLTEHRNLTSLDVRGNDVGGVYPRYAFATIFSNNVKNSGFRFNVIDGASAYSASNPYNATLTENAAALSGLNEIGQVYKSLHLPVSAGGKAIRWSSNSGLIAIGDAGDSYYGVTITTPPVDTYVTLTAHIGNYEEEVTRSMTVLLLSDRGSIDANKIYIERAGGGYARLDDEVPDRVLRSLLVSLVNSDDETSIDVDGTPVGGLNVITRAEIAAWVAGNPAPQFTWADRGITNLAGLDTHFADMFGGATLNLSNNSISDITPLGNLGGLSVLYLGSAKYDFAPLSNLTSLTYLHVYECYGLSDDKVLASLYDTYISNRSVVIYKDNATTAWDPYAELLPIYVRSLPSFYSFMDKGDSYTLLDGATARVTFTFYGKEIVFSSNAGTVSGANNYTRSNTAITLNAAVARDTTSYVQYTLSGTDGRGSTVSYNRYFVELLAEANTRFAVRFDNGELKPLDEVFTGYTIRASVLSPLYDSSFSERVNAAKTAGAYCVVTLAELKALNIGAVNVDGTYETDDPLGGLQYLNVTSLTISRDANLGDGSALVNITSLDIRYSFINFASISTPLPKLATLTISGSNTAPVFYKKNSNVKYYQLTYGGEAYLVPVHDYYLRWFTGLNTLTVTDQKITDWTFLFGLLFTDDGGQKLNVSSTAASGLAFGDKFVTHNLKSLDITGNNSNTYVVTTANSGVLNLGTINGVVSGDFAAAENDGFHSYSSTVGFGIVSALFRSTSAPTYYLNSTDIPYSMSEKSYEFAIDPNEEYDIFDQYVTDLGAKMDGNLLALDEDQAAASGAQLSLPLTTYAYTGTDFGSDEYFTRAFGIKWSIYGTSSDLTVSGATGVTDTASHSLGFNTLTYNFTTANFTTAPTKENYKTATLDLTLSATRDYYIILVGTIGEYYYDNANGAWARLTGQTVYTYFYPLLITSGDANADVNAASFGKIKDTALRFQLFAAFADRNYNGNLSAYTSTGVSTAKKIYLNWNGGTVSNYGNNSRHIDSIFPNPRSFASSPISLDGIGVLDGLTEVRFASFPLVDIDEISKLPRLETLQITRSSAMYLPELPSSVKSADFSYGHFFDISNLGKSNCPDLTTLNLFENDINADMLGYIYDPSAQSWRFPELTTLNLTNNQCSFDYAMIEWVYCMTNAANVNLPSGLTINDWTVNGAISDLRSGYRGITGDDNNAVLVYPEYSSGSWSDYYASVSSAANQYTKTADFASQTVTKGDYTIAFRNATILNFVNGDLIKDQTLTVGIYPTTKACWFSSTTPMYADVNFYDNGRSDIYVQGRTETGNTTHATSEFDTAFLAYLISSGHTTPGANSVYKVNVSTIALASNHNIRSLKGANYLGFTSLELRGNPLLSSLWGAQANNAAPELETLTLGGCNVRAEELRCLEFTGSPLSLNFRYARGVDYTKIGNGLKNVTSIITNSAFWAASDSVRDGNIKMLKGEYSIGNKLFGTIPTVTIYNSNKKDNVTEANDNTKNVTRDALTYFYAAAQTNFDNINKLQNVNADGSKIYKNSVMTYTLGNISLDNILASLEFAGGRSATVTNGNIVTYYNLPVGETISYSDISSGMVFPLPQSSTQYGTAHPITWSVLVNNVDRSEFFIENGSLTLSAANIDKLELGNNVASVTLVLRAVIRHGADATLYYTRNYNITINNISSSSGGSTSDAINYDLYVEDEDGTVTPADEVFESGRFIEWIFGGSYNIGNAKVYNNRVRNTNNGVVTYSQSTTTYGVEVNMLQGWGIVASAANRTFTYNGVTLGDNALVLTYDLCQRIYSIDASATDGNPKGITSIKGIEIFSNLKEFYFLGGNFTDLSPLINTELTLFSYQNASGGGAAASFITDFTPLVKGSGNTLEVFVYDSFASVQVTDMTFLLGFEKLKEAYLFGSSPYNGYTVSNGSLGTLTQYLETPSFSYLVSALSDRSARLYIGGIEGTGTNKIRTDVDSGVWAKYYSYINVSPSFDSKGGTKKTNIRAVELRPRDGVTATNALKSFDSRVNPYYTVTDGYALTLNGGAVKADDNSNNYVKVSAKLPAMLVSGNLHAIDWSSSSSRISVVGYGITGSLTTGGVTYDANNVFGSYAAFKEFLANNEAAAYNAMNTGAFDVYVNVTLTLPVNGTDANGNYISGLHQSMLPVLLRAEIGGVTYERMLSIDLAATLSAAVK